MTVDEELYIILKPSPIHGVGVFTERKIKKGEIVKIWHGGDWRDIPHCSGRLKKMCDRYGDGTYIPENFTRMSLAFYLNHSPKNNLIVDNNGHAHATRNIAKNEELTINYGQFSTQKEKDK